MSELHEEVMKKVTYLKHGVLKVGRNSDFNTDELTDDQLEELGGIEYRALRALSWIVGLVCAMLPNAPRKLTTPLQVLYRNAVDHVPRLRRLLVLD